MNELKVYAELQKGGAWLGAARSWLQSNIKNGDTLTWGSGEPVTVQFWKLEEFAMRVAVVAVADERQRAQPHAQANEDKLSEHKAILRDPNGILLLMAYHRNQMTVANAVGASDTATHHLDRLAELKKIGQAIMVQNLESWSAELLAAFGFDDEYQRRLHAAPA